MAEPLELVVRAVVMHALEDCPALLPQDRRYADLGALRVAKEQVVVRVARELAASGFLPIELSEVRSLSNFHAVSYTIGQMRSRLLKHIRGGGRDAEAEREAMESIAVAFFSDLEDRGWRLVRTTLPAPPHSTPR
jgi:hypothetical protein